MIQSFPWLSAIAQQYEEHKPLGIVFEFKSLSADAIASSTNNTLGGIIMSTDYNATNAAFVNKQQMDNTEYTTSAKPSCSFYHPVECDPRTNPISTLYVRSGAPPSNADLRLYDLGSFQIASFGIQGTSVVAGELWCTYEWEFRKPISTTALGQDVLSDHFQLGSVTNAHPLGTTSVLQSGSSIGGTITGSGHVYNFPAVYQEGNYMVVYYVTGTAASLSYPVVTPTNCSILEIWGADGTSTPTSPINGVSAATAMMTFVVSLSGLDATLSFSTGGTLPSAFVGGDLMVTQIDSSIIT